MQPYTVWLWPPAHACKQLPCSLICCRLLLSRCAGSRPSSRGDSRPASRSELSGRDNGALPAVPEEPAAPAGWAAAAAGSSRGIGWAQAAEAVPEATHAAAQLHQEASGLHDADGFLIDDSLDAEVSLEVSRGPAACMLPLLAYRAIP